MTITRGQLDTFLHSQQIADVQRDWPEHRALEEWQIDDTLGLRDARTSAPTMVLYSQDDVQKYLHKLVDRLDFTDRTLRLDVIVRRVLRIQPKPKEDVAGLAVEKPSASS